MCSDIGAMERAERRVWADMLIAAALACVLTAAWTWRDWANLSALRLPDADDMMRLQQIRDWLSGQAFGDLTQYRLGANGVSMHWSRLADLVPGGIIWTLRGTIGEHQAELVAVVAWPAMLLAAAVALTGRIARAIGGTEVAVPAMVVAAIAHPASTLFVPGRIDHHGLQLVLLLVAVLMIAGPRSAAAGLVAGIASALSLVVGMETAPLLAAAAAVLIAEWASGAEGGRERLLGFGTGVAGSTLAASFVFHTIGWNYPACDGFTAISARAATIAALVPIGLPLLGQSANRTGRFAIAGAAGIALLGAISVSAPQCLSPYGGVDPLLQRLWLTRVAEAQGLFDAPATIAFGYAGLPLAGLAATAWLAWRTRERGWTLLLVLQLAAVAVMAMQLRGAYAGALLAAPALGAVIVAARRKGILALTAAWAGSAGIFYPMAAQAMITPQGGTPGASCTAPDLIEALDRLAAGTVMAPIDTGAPAIAATDQRLIAGAYHRDGAGDLAMYSFYRAAPDEARRIALHWNVRWVVACNGFAGVPAPFAAQLERGSAPEWLAQVDRVPSGARIFRVNRSER
jgi:hypothetical protein